MFICIEELTPGQGHHFRKEWKGFPSKQAATHLPSRTRSSKLRVSPTRQRPDSQGEVTARSQPGKSSEVDEAELAQRSARCVLNSCLMCRFQQQTLFNEQHQSELQTRAERSILRGLGLHSITWKTHKSIYETQRHGHFCLSRHVRGDTRGETLQP